MHLQSKYVALHLLHSVNCRIPSIPFTRPCTVCRIDFVPQMVCIFEGHHIYFRSRFFLLLCFLFTKCRKRTHVGVTLSVQTSELISVVCTVQDASTKNCRKNLIFVYIGPVWPPVYIGPVWFPVLHETRNGALSILTLTNTRRICT